MYPAPTGHLSSTPSRLTGSLPMRYPSPFFDIASTWYPRTIRELLQYCRVYFYTQPLIAATISKLARYPVTDVVVTHSSEAVAKQWMWFLREHLRIRSFLIAAHLDKYVHGNCFTSLIFPFIRQLVCQKCGSQVGARLNNEDWIYSGGRFVLDCRRCHTRAPAIVRDIPLKSPKGIKLHRWDPMDVVIDDGDYPGTSRYLYRVPRILTNAIRLGKKNVVSLVPLDFLEAVEQSKMAIFAHDNFFHTKRVVLSGKHKGWGMPLVAPVLKYAFYLQIMMKAQEQVLTELMVPLRIVFPQSATPTSDPYGNVWMETWKKKIEAEIRRWRADNSYIPVLPLPVGHQTIGGEGRSLLLGGEIRMLIEQIIAALEVPLEFVFAGTSYSASMVSLRQLENLCLSDVEDDREMLRWIIDSVAGYLQWPKPDDVYFKPFKTADDLARKQFYLALNQAGRVSGHTVCSVNDLDYDAELDLIEAEAKKEARINALRGKLSMQSTGEAQIVQARYGVRAQAAASQQAKSLQQGPLMGITPPGGIGGPQGTEQPEPSMEDVVPGSPVTDGGLSIQLGPGGQTLELSGQGGNVPLGDVARQIAQQVANMQPAQQQQYLQQLQSGSPQLHGVVMQMLGPAQEPQAPMPEQRPPRRQMETI